MKDDIMATETLAPPRPKQYGPSVFTQTVLPVVLLLTLIGGIGAAVVYVVLWYLPGVAAGKDLVLRRLEDPITLRGQELSPYLWLAILIPILVVGLFYVIWMYVRDGVTIGWAWASFLGLLRCTVYALLALVFLLPSLQAWEESKSESRVAIAFDISRSILDTKDEIPGPDTPLEKLPTRQDKVLRFLGDEKVSFFKQLQEKNPVFAYRFGRSLDEGYMVFDKNGDVWASEAWEARLKATDSDNPAKPIPSWSHDTLTAWLRPDLNPQIPDSMEEDKRKALAKKVENLRHLVGATNLGTPLRKVYDREKNNLLQGIIIFTDGRNTEGSTDPIKTLVEDARRADPPIPIFVVAIGEERERVRIEITDVRVPEQIRPEDRFRATVDLTGEGLVGKKVQVFLDIARYNRKTEKPEGEIVLVETQANGEATGNTTALGPQVTLQAEALFQPGSPPHAQVEFPLDAATLAKAAGKEVRDGFRVEFKDEPEGELRFTARVGRDPREDFADKEHKSDPAGVQVVKRPLRILLFASGPMRDYQFVRTMLVREMDKNRAEVCLYLQPVPGQETPRLGRVQDVPPERLLTRFPDKLQDEKLDKPDDKFYNLANYDAIVAFDPDWTRLNEQQLRMVEQWVGTHGGGLVVIGGPVNTVQLARPGAYRDKLKPIIDIYPVVLEDSRIQEVTRETDKPHRLNFPGATGEMEFLKLDEENPKMPPLQAWEDFFGGLKSGEKPSGPIKVVQRGFYNFYPVQQKKEGATTVATFSDIAARMKDGQEQPYLVIMPYGSGKTVWLGSAETWRLRQYKESYHERFWTKMARYAASGNLSQGGNRRVTLNMGRTFTANNYITIEARLLGTDMKPMPQRTTAKVTVKPPAGLGEQEAATEYDLKPKPSAGSEWSGWFTVRFMARTPGKYGVQLEVPETKDTANGSFIVKEANPELDNTRPDFSNLYELASDAERILARVDADTARELKTRLARRVIAADPMRKEAAPDGQLRLLFDLSNADLIPRCMKVDTKTQRNRGASSDLWDGGFTIWNREPPETPIRMSTILAIVVGLFSVEWLTRKLLRLA